MSLVGFLDKIKEKKSFIEGSQQNLPVNSQGEILNEVFDRFLSVSNCRQLSFLRRDERGIAAILDAYANCRDEYDIDGFMMILSQNMFILSSAENGMRSEQLQNIAVGQMNRNFALELAEIRSGEGNKELKDV